MLIIVLALLCAATGIGLNLWSWQGGRQYPRTAVIAGWLCVAASVALWSAEIDVEFGLVVGLGIASVLAWLIVSTQLRHKPATLRHVERRSPSVPGARTVGRQFVLFVLVMLLAGIASLLLSMGLSRLMPADEITRLATVMLLLPIVWGVLAFVITYSQRPGVMLAWVSIIGGAGFGLMVV
ncbi:MAG: hypothetical protein AAGA84_00775 [Pseudomonadota bacterium]